MGQGVSVTENDGFVGPIPIAGRVSSLAVLDEKTVYIGTSGGGVWKTTDGGRNWIPKTDTQPNLSIGALAFDPTNSNVIYAGTGEFIQYYDAYPGVGILRSRDAGETWRLLPDPAGVFVGAKVSRIAVDAGNPRNIYAATNRGLIISTDGGHNWGSVKMGACSQISDVVIDHTTTPSTVYAASSPLDTGWYVTDNPGCNGIWRSNPPLIGQSSGESPPSFSRLTTGVPAGNMMRLALQFDPNSGAGGTSGQRGRGAFDKKPKGILYLAMQVYIPDSPEGGHQFDLKVYKSTNGGNSWQYVAMVFPGNWGVFGIAVQRMSSTAQTTDAIYVASLELLTSTDSGQKWKFSTYTESDPAQANPTTADPDKISPYRNRKTHYDLQAVGVVRGDARKIFIATDGGIYKSEDYGQTYTNLNETLGNVHFYRGAVSNELSPSLIGSMHDSGFVRTYATIDRGNWFRVQGGEVGSIVFDPQNYQRVYITRNDGALVRRSLDGGFTFRDASRDISPCGGRDFLPPLAINPKNSQHLLAVTDMLYESLDGADTWHGFGGRSQFPNDGAVITAIAPAFSSFTIYVARGAKVFKLTSTGVNKAASLSDATFDLANFSMVRTLAVDPDNPNTVYAGLWAASGTPRLRKLEGNNWVDTTMGLPDANVNSIVINPANSKDIYVATDKGTYRSLDAGARWFSITDGMPNAIAYDVVLNQTGTMLYVFTHGRGVWRANVKDLPTGPRRSPR
ncbi:MAG TPA: hypothetical protein VF658_14160 [Pyrinomonadaceae bacterium]|jgi:hypothetical protein